MKDPSGQERFKPLPFRREFRRIILPRLKEGAFIIPEDEPEYWDVRNAAQTIVINHLHPKVIESFQRPTLLVSDDFYRDFEQIYNVVVVAAERDAWAGFRKEFDERFAEMSAQDLDNLTDMEAAYLTLYRDGRDPMPSGQELFFFLPKYAQVYESLLRAKYGAEYSDELLYASLRENMPKFILQFIAMDAVILNVVNINSTPREIEGDKADDAPFDPRVMELDDHNGLKFKKAFVDAVHAHAKEHGLREDRVGRTEDRGCPVLFAESEVRDGIISFAIEELIAQHQARFGTQE